MSAMRPRNVVASSERVTETVRIVRAHLLRTRVLRLDARRLARENANVRERLLDAEARNRLKQQLLDRFLV